MKHSKRTATGAIAALVLCLSATIFVLRISYPVTHPVPPETPVPVSLKAAESLEEKLGYFFFLSPNNSFELGITEEEITSYLAVKYPEAIFRDTQVRIENNKACISALITDPIKTSIQILCSIGMVNEQIRIEFQQIRLGWLNLPSFLLKSLAFRLNEMIDTAPLAVSITDVQLQESSVIISVYRKIGEP